MYACIYTCIYLGFRCVLCSVCVCVCVYCYYVRAVLVRAFIGASVLAQRLQTTKQIDCVGDAPCVCVW